MTGLRQFVVANLYLVALLVLLASSATLSVITAFASIRININPLRAPIEFPSVQNQTDAVCPGETLRYQMSFAVGRPAILHFTRSVWSVTAQQNAVADSAPLTINYPDPVEVSRVSEYPLPALAPGNYEFRTGVQEVNSAPVFFRFPFRVKSC